MRFIFGSVLLVVIVAVGTILFQYGTLDPCRMLAQDLADEGYGQIASVIGVEPGETPESAHSMARMMTSQYTQKECMTKLKDRWLGLEKPAQ
ncbi:MAG: hypothetical protein Q7T44_11145 [Parvibaculum sp.]|nr:hypothetical protein [Parvibaculum sp.]